MKYIGETLVGRELSEHLDFTRASIVLITGEFPNTCGHILLYVGGGFGHYFHFDGPTVFDYPRYIWGDSGYQRFLASHGSHELLRQHVMIPHPDRARQKLEELMRGKWLTFLISHNCATFVGQVLRAGGNFYDVPEHCPVLDMALNQIFVALRAKLGTEQAYASKHLR